jgi:hypothetical protein
VDCPLEGELILPEDWNRRASQPTSEPVATVWACWEDDTGTFVVNSQSDRYVEKGTKLYDHAAPCGSCEEFQQAVFEARTALADQSKQLAAHRKGEK